MENLQTDEGLSVYLLKKKNTCTNTRSLLKPLKTWMETPQYFGNPLFPVKGKPLRVEARP